MNGNIQGLTNDTFMIFWLLKSDRFFGIGAIICTYRDIQCLPHAGLVGEIYVGLVYH